MFMTTKQAARDSALISVNLWTAGNELNAWWATYFAAMQGGF
jgi:hypothetical protein